MTYYNKGRSYEYRVIKELENQNYLCIRSSGSHSPFDVVAISPQKIRLIQVKYENRLHLNHEKYYKTDIDIIKCVTIPNCCTKELWVYTKNNGCKKYVIQHY